MGRNLIKAMFSMSNLTEAKVDSSKVQRSLIKNGSHEKVGTKEFLFSKKEIEKKTKKIVNSHEDC